MHGEAIERAPLLVYSYFIVMRVSVHRVVVSSASRLPVLRRLASNAVTPISSERLTIAPRNGGTKATIQIDDHPSLSSDVCCAVFTKSSRVFARVGKGSEEAVDGLSLSLLAAESGVFLEGTQMRMDVDYLVSANAVISFGDVGNECFVVEFEEPSPGSSGGDAVGKMLMQGMAAGASKDVREALKDKL